jgi:SAM-dependent methyltransferase
MGDLYESADAAAGYAAVRRTDPRIAARIWGALGGARTVANVGAGTGAYEPPDRDVVAVERSAAMIARRPPGSARAILASAESIPLDDGSVDAAMAVLAVHHFGDPAAALREMRRIARGPVVVLTWDPATAGSFWLVRDYLPGVALFDAERFPSIEAVRDALGGGAVTPVPIPHDCRDGFLGAYWRRPEAYLDPRARAGTSALRDGADPAVAAGLARLAADLEDGTWRMRNGQIMRLAETDLGYRLVVST